MQTAVAIAGTGRMGTAMAKRLVETGHAVTVWNRSPDRTGDAVAAGARALPTRAELVASAPILITSLTDAAALQETYEGPDGLLAAAGDTLFIEMSTVLPSEARALAETVRGRGAAFLECPVGGTVGPALKGQLLGMAGGRPKDFERARPVLEALCKRVELCGESGAGAAMKLAVNLPLALYWHTLGEALNMLTDEGLDGAFVASVLADSSAGPNVLKNRMEVVAKTIDGADQPGTFDIAGLSKDLQLALRWGEANGRAMAMAEAAAPTYAAAIDSGLGHFDGASLARFIRAGGAAS